MKSIKSRVQFRIHFSFATLSPLVTSLAKSHSYFHSSGDAIAIASSLLLCLLSTKIRSKSSGEQRQLTQCLQSVSEEKVQIGGPDEEGSDEGKNKKHLSPRKNPVASCNTGSKWATTQRTYDWAARTKWEKQKTETHLLYFGAAAVDVGVWRSRSPIRIWGSVDRGVGGASDTRQPVDEPTMHTCCKLHIFYALALLLSRWVFHSIISTSRGSRPH